MYPMLTLTLKRCCVWVWYYAFIANGAVDCRTNHQETRRRSLLNLEATCARDNITNRKFIQKDKHSAVSQLEANT